jgi:hypothetical protein
MWVVSYYHFWKKIIKNFLVREFLIILIFYKID